LNKNAGETSLVTRRGLLLVLSSPSGAGKTTLARRLLSAETNIRMSVSLTTRKPRRGEIDGADYHFVDKGAFDKLKRGRKLLEWAEVFGYHYATPRAPVVAALEAGEDMLFDIDWQGARQLKKRLPRDVVRVFILPPDAETLERRLRTRNQDADAVVARRMAAASAEIAHWNEYDYTIVNADIDASVEGLLSILAAERLKRSRQTGLKSFVARLQTGL
jgi:guanylate kinase